MEGREAPSRPPNPALPYREDCWSEGETSALVDAWGDHYVELNRGNLRQKHWQEVADAVNSRRGAGRRPPRTDVQCKNRIDTLKKKYKVEKARVAAGGAESEWPFFYRLELLIGSAPPPPAKKSPALLPVALPLPTQRKRSALPDVEALRAVEPKKKRVSAVAFPVDDQIFRRAAAAAAAAAAAEEDEEEEEEVGSGSISLSRSSSRSKKGKKKGGKGKGNGIRDLARAIMRFAEIYESVEEAKQRQTLELEKQRMEFAKALEFQKLQMFVDTQVQLAKIKRVKRSYTGRQL